MQHPRWKPEDDAVESHNAEELTDETFEERLLEYELGMGLSPFVNVTEVKLFGTVSGLAGGSFMIGTSEMRFDETTLLEDFGPDGLRDGLEVRVEPSRDRDEIFRRREVLSGEPEGGL